MGARAVSGFEDAKVLIQHATAHLGRIRQAYEESLREKHIKPTLLVEIKNLMENLRSALDFSAQALHAKYGSTAASRPKVYFPYALDGQSAADFRKTKRVEACIPGLAANRPDIVSTLESFQAFADPKNAWLPRFMELNNANKHQSLTPQERRESKTLTIKAGGAAMTLGSGASISVAPGASIVVGGKAIIPGGQTFSADRPPVARGQGSGEVTTWVSFHFTATDEPVVPFLEAALQGTERIVTVLQKA